jgi:hypothetical protein
MLKDQFASNAPGDEAVKLAHDWLLRFERQRPAALARDRSDAGQSQPDAFPLYDVDQPAGAISKQVNRPNLKDPPGRNFRFQGQGLR